MVAKLFPAALVIGLTIWVAQVQSQLLTGTPPNPLHHQNTARKKEPRQPCRPRALHHLQRSNRPPLRRNRNVFAERQQLRCLLVPLQLQSRHRRPADSGSHVCSNPRGRRPPVHPAGIPRLQLEVVLRQGPALRRDDVIRALGRRSKIDHLGYATVTEAKPLIPADGLRRDRFFRLALACRRSSASTQPERLTQSQDPRPFWSRSR